MGLDTGCPLLSPFLAVISCNARGGVEKNISVGIRHLSISVRQK